MKILLKILILTAFVGAVVIGTANSGICSDEMQYLKESNFYGDMSKSKRIKEKGEITLKQWEPAVQYNKSIGMPIEGIESLKVNYDEIWEKINNEGFPNSMKKQLKGKFDITKLYWLKGKVQASVLLKYYESNPLTNRNPNPPGHKITSIYNRTQVLTNIK